MPAANSNNSDRHVNLSQLARLIGRDPNTVRRWVEVEDCPTVERGDKRTGKTWVFDVADVVRWLCNRAAESAAATAAVNGIPDYETARARHEFAKAQMAEIELAELQGDVIRISDAAERIMQDYADIRTTLLQIPGSVAPHLVNRSAPEIQVELQKHVDRVLTSLQYEAALDRTIDGDRPDEAGDGGDDV